MMLFGKRAFLPSQSSFREFIFIIPEQNSLKSRADPGVYWKVIDFERVFGPAWAMY